MKKIIFTILLFCFYSPFGFSEKNIRVNFLNQKIEVEAISPYSGTASLTLDNRSFNNFTLKLMKNDQIFKYITLSQSSTKTIDVPLTQQDTLFLVPYNPSMRMLKLVSSD